MVNIEKKSMGLVDLEARLKTLEEMFSSFELEIFCDRTPSGEALVDMFNKRRDAFHCSENLRWYYFAAEIIGKFMTPRSCKLPTAEDRRRNRVQGALCDMRMAQGVGPYDEVMTKEEILEVHRQLQPSLNKMRRALCVDCKMQSCRWFLRIYEIVDPDDDTMGYEYPEVYSRAWNERAIDMQQPLRLLMRGSRDCRQELGRKMLEQILPLRQRDHLERQGVSCLLYSVPSLKNPRLFLSFSKDGRDEHVSVEIGKKRVKVNYEPAPELRLVGDVRECVENAIRRLTAEKQPAT